MSATPIHGVLSYGAYVPRHRLDRRQIRAALGAGGGSGTRAVAGPDEDATTMGVAAAHEAMRAAGAASPPASVWFATTAPPYADKTNATAIHAALGLDRDTAAYDLNGAVRSGIGALRAAAGQDETSLVVFADVRSGLPGSADEHEGADGAAALVIGPGRPIAEFIGRASCTEEFLDRWRNPRATASRTWEERFGEQVYVPLGQRALDLALKDADIALGDVDHLVVSGAHTRAVRSLGKKLASRVRAIVDDRAASIGNAGCAQLGLLLADALDVAEPGAVIAVVNLSDGADAFVLRCTDELPGYRTRRSPRRTGTGDVAYTTFLLWRGELRREPQRRPDPDVPVAPAAHRGQRWKFAFEGSRCETCGSVFVPPQRVCAQCGAIDRMTPTPVADAVGTILTVTTDYLAFSENPPLRAAVVDFDGGARVQCELTDLGEGEPRRGDRVEMTFRRAYTVNDIHNYVWKARPIEEAARG